MAGGRRLAQGISARLSPKELRRFGLTIAIPLSLLAGLGAWRGHTLVAGLLVSAAVALGALALLAPRLLGPFHTGWMRSAEVLSWVNTRILLSVVYYGVMTPTGLLMRVLGRDPLDRGLHDRPTYWVARSPHGDPKDAMEHRF